MPTATIHTQSGRDLDTYCDTIDGLVSGINIELESVKLEDIPSPAQREAFRVMRELLGWVPSFSGTLRYDVQTTHEECEHHDEHALQTVERCREALQKL